MTKAQQLILFGGLVAFAVYGLTCAPHRSWDENAHVHPVPRGNLFNSAWQERYILDDRRFLAESAFILVIVAGVTIASAGYDRK